MRQNCPGTASRLPRILGQVVEPVQDALPALVVLIGTPPGGGSTDSTVACAFFSQGDNRFG
jgi:hypothetical protein